MIKGEGCSVHTNIITVKLSIADDYTVLCMC